MKQILAGSIKTLKHKTNAEHMELQYQLFLIKAKAKAESVERKKILSKSQDRLPIRLCFKPNIEVVHSTPKAYNCELCKDSKKIKTMTRFGIITKDCDCK